MKNKKNRNTKKENGYLLDKRIDEMKERQRRERDEERVRKYGMVR